VTLLACHCRYGFSERLAQALEAGIAKTGVEVDLVDLSTADTQVCSPSPCFPLCLSHRVSHCVSLAASLTVSPSLCFPHCVSLTVSPSLSLSHRVSHCVYLTVSLTVPPTVSPSPSLSPCLSLYVPGRDRGGGVQQRRGSAVAARRHGDGGACGHHHRRRGPQEVRAHLRELRRLGRARRHTGQVVRRAGRYFAHGAAQGEAGTTSCHPRSSFMEAHLHLCTGSSWL
jgi:hypothetical protein